MTILNEDSNLMVDFLNNLFKKLHDYGIIYCVLRNYDDLPENIENDIDIWVKNGQQKEFRKILLNVASELKWETISFLPRLSFRGEGDYFFLKRSPKIFVVHIDCWSIIYRRGISYVDENILANNLKWHNNGFFIPSPGIEAAIMLLKNLIYHGSVQEKYKRRISKFCTVDTNNSISTLRNPIGHKIARVIVKSAIKSEWKSIEKKFYLLRWKLFWRALYKKPIFQIKIWALYFFGQAKKYFNPKNGVFIVLLGPDGSGKSTAADRLVNTEIKKLFQKRLYFHGQFSILPRLNILALTKRRKKSVPFMKQQDEKEVFGTFRSMIYPIYYGLDFFLGHILVWKERARGGMIIFDRYFYDYFIQDQFKNCPRWLIYTIGSMIPKPDLLIHLKNTPDIIYSRKSELRREEIARQSAICFKLVNQVSYGVSIDTSTIEEVVQKIQELIIARLKENHGKS